MSHRDAGGGGELRRRGTGLVRAGTRTVPTATLILALLLAAAPAGAQVFESIGERALGMGGAFVAVADDASATYWNPAGLATGASFDACLARATGEARTLGQGLEGPLTTGNAGASFCLAVPAFGFSYNTLRTTGGGGHLAPTGEVAGDRQDLRPREVRLSSLTTRQVGITLVQSLLPGVAVGATLKYVRGRAAGALAPAGTSADDLLDRASELGGRGSGALDADLGAMLSAGPLRLGVVLRNAREPGFDADDGTRLRLERQARVGIAMTPGREAVEHAAGDGWILAVDADLTRTRATAGDRRMVAAGVERWLAGHRVGVRAGGRGNTVGPPRPAGSAGVSLGVRSGIFLEAHVVRGGTDADRGWGVGMRAGF
jgi:hypothetical protein